MSLFDSAVEEIKHQYDALGHQLGWRFLGVSKANLNPVTQIALVTANPAGHFFFEDCPAGCCETGSAYLVEQWGTAAPGKSKLQKQVQGLFHALSKHRGGAVSGESLLEQSLIAYFIPFRSPRLAQLHRREESIAFARRLWRKLFTEIRPRLVIAIDRESYAGISEAVAGVAGSRISHAAFPTGWGAYTADIDEYHQGDYRTTLVRLPHLSTFQIFTSAGCREAVKAIVERSCQHLL